MTFRSTVVTSSPSLVRLPICELIPALQDRSLVEFQSYMAEMTLKMDPTTQNLHVAFLQARDVIESYRTKSTPDGIVSVFDGYIQYISCPNGDGRYNLSGIDGAHTVRLSPEHLNLLINIIQVYKAYSIQQFKIKKLVDQIRVLEFPPAIYQRINSLLGQMKVLEEDSENDRIIRQFHQLLSQLNIEQIASESETVQDYARTLHAYAIADETNIKQVLSSIQQLQDRYRTEWSSISNRILALNWHVDYDLPKQKIEVAGWLRQVDALAKRKKYAVKPEEMAAIDRDIASFTTDYKAKKAAYLQLQERFIKERTELNTRMADYQRALPERKAAIERRAHAEIEKLQTSLPLPPHYSVADIMHDRIFNDVKNAHEHYSELYRKWKKIELGLQDSLRQIKDFLKVNLRTTSYNNRTELLRDKWNQIIGLFREVVNTKIALDLVTLNTEIIDQINSVCNISYDCVQKIRDDTSIQSEIVCIQSEAQQYVNKLSAAKAKSDELLASLQQFEQAVIDLNTEMAKRMQACYDGHVAQHASRVVDAQQVLCGMIADASNSQSGFLDVKRDSLIVIDAKQLEKIDKKIEELQQPVNRKQDEPLRAEPIALPNRRQQKKSFFKRHGSFLWKAALASAVVSVGIGGGLALGMIFAPMTFGVSIPVAIGIGAGVAAAIVTAGAVMALGSCMVSDAFVTPTHSRHESKQPLIGGSTAEMRRGMPDSPQLAPSDQWADRVNDDLAFMDEILTSLPDNFPALAAGDYPAAAVAVGAGSSLVQPVQGPRM